LASIIYQLFFFEINDCKNHCFQKIWLLIMKTKFKRILIDESKIPESLLVSTRFNSFIHFRTGIFTLLERIKLIHENYELYYRGLNSAHTAFILSCTPGLKSFSDEVVDEVIYPTDISPWGLLSRVSRQISEDLELFKDHKKWSVKIKVKPDNYRVVGKSKHLFVHPNAEVYPGVVFDVSSGPIVIDKGVRITSFSFLAGPLYVGPDTNIDNARITGGTIIGRTCRLGGEIENSIIGNFTNKHHEGFLGHSLIGNWINIGAMATTSDLKNNYGPVKISIKDTSIHTGTIKFGSIIGDFSKIAIGTMLNTGTVIDVGSNIIDTRISGYIPPFTWIKKDQKYRLDLFLDDTKKIMARRNQAMSQEFEELVKSVYEA
jgi:glucose-1-phosphate thymidylyltransferase